MGEVRYEPNCTHYCVTTPCNSRLQGELPPGKRGCPGALRVIVPCPAHACTHTLARLAEESRFNKGRSAHDHFDDLLSAIGPENHHLPGEAGCLPGIPQITDRLPVDGEDDIIRA